MAGGAAPSKGWWNAAPWPIKTAFDCIFCRNVMIYFDAPTQRRVLERLHAKEDRPHVLVLTARDRVTPRLPLWFRGMRTSCLLVDGGDNRMFARYLAGRFRGTSKEKPRVVDCIVVTHGTDTLEETAYFLNLVVRTDKPPSYSVFSPYLS